MMEKGRKTFVATPLTIPLFLIRRQSLKRNYPKTLKHYVVKHAKSCLKSIRNERTNVRKRVAILYKKQAKQYNTCRKVYGKVKRDLIDNVSWKLPPNLYNISKEPFKRDKEKDNAYWFVDFPPRKSTRRRLIKENIDFNNLPSGREKLINVCHKHKGTLFTNARDRKPYIRCMIFDATLCYRDPNGPSPTTYNLLPKKIEVKKVPVPNEHEFYRWSCVPITRNAIHRRNTSFEPAPGRYDARFIKICPCSGKLLYVPDLQIFIDRQKRLKLRRLPYMKINPNLYYTPEWQHVHGHGFQYLFKKSKPKTIVQLKRSETVKKSMDVKLNYIDAQYINMITEPTRNPISLRYETIRTVTSTTEYTGLRKSTVRNTLLVSKKIAFGSGQRRFQDDPPVFYTRVLEQLKKIKGKLPPELRLRNHPVMKQSIKDIKSKYKIIPSRLCVPKIPMPLKDFTFSPLPEPKILVTKTDIRYDVKDGNRFYYKSIKPENYFKVKVIERNVTKDTKTKKRIHIV